MPETVEVTSAERAQMLASDLGYMRVEIDKEAWDDHNEVIRAQRVPRWEPPDSFTWQYNGETFTVKVGEVAMFPSAVALHGIKKSLMQPRVVDERGEALLEFDRHGDTYPRLVQVGRELVPGDLASPAPVMPEPAKRLCAFCEAEVSQEDFEEHLASEHADKLQGALERATAPAVA